MQIVGSRLTGRPGRKKRNRATGLMSEINVTPFVDVMLVLLIIFMVTAPLLTTGVKVDLPEATAEALPGQDEPLEITVKQNGDIYLQDTQIALNEIGPKLAAITQQKSDTRIFVRGDKTVNYGRMITVISTINGAGFTKVGLVTEPLTDEK